LRILAVGLALIFGVMSGVGPAAAEDFTPPKAVSFSPDWAAARAALTSGSDDGIDRLTERTAALAARFPAITDSPVPVLLPLAAAGEDEIAPPFEHGDFFQAGPTGYDATFLVRTRDHREFDDINLIHPVGVQISGFAMLYDLPDANGAIAQPAGAAEQSFPGIRKQILESTLRYSFERFGIPYVVSIQCFDGQQTRTRLSCRNADRIAQRFLQTLRLAGGNPNAAMATTPVQTIERPEQESSVFTYHAAGDLLPGTAMRAVIGDADHTVYARIRFPTASAPAFANSQSFMHGGDCNQTGSSRAANGYRCRLTGKQLFRDESTAENYAYPWRDNFCENRHYFVGRCPAGLGHQGVDIRPASCTTTDTNNTRCQPYQHGVVAVRDGMIQREAWQAAFSLDVNAPGERIRFRYLHMNPGKLDEDGVISGRKVAEGEPLGLIGNFNRRPGWTTAHLHFEIQVPTRDGWVRVNPYTTLVASYEHLIGARGRLITDEHTASTELDASDSHASAAAKTPRSTKSKAAKAKAAKSKAARTKGKSKASKARHHGSAKAHKSRGKKRR